ncbi:MAG: NADPH:quinone reductase [Neomegalonema sp.]
MKAAYYDRFGPARDVLTVGDLETPQPQTGEVLVHVRASGVNPSDVKLRAGNRPGGVAAEMPFPRIVPHSDGAGEIEAVGHGVDASRIGERVWLWNAQWGRAFGSCAEYVALPAEQAVTLPAATSFAAGACAGIPMTTACHCVFADGDVTGKTVLVTGAAGAVGRYAVQMAKLGGARVLATISGAEKAQVAKEAGADVVINYREEDVASRVLAETNGAGVDRIVEVEFGGNLAVSNAIIAPNGVIATYASLAAPEHALPFYQMMFKNETLRMTVVYQLSWDARRAVLERLTPWLSADALEHKIAGAFPLSETAAAHEMVEAGDKIGAVVVEI